MLVTIVSTGRTLDLLRQIKAGYHQGLYAPESGVV